MAFAMSPEDKGFTNSQVGALIESFKNDIKAIAEDLSSVREDITVLKTDMTHVKEDLTQVKDAVRLAIPALTKRVTNLEAKVGA